MSTRRSAAWHQITVAIMLFFPTLLKPHLVWLRCNMHKVVRCTCCYPGNHGCVPRWNRPERYYQSLHRYTVVKNDLIKAFDKEPQGSSVSRLSLMFTTKWFNIWSVQKRKPSMFKGILCQAGWRTALCLQSQQVRNAIYLSLQRLLFLKHQRFKKIYTCKWINAFGSDPLHDLWSIKTGIWMSLYGSMKLLRCPFLTSRGPECWFIVNR